MSRSVQQLAVLRADCNHCNPVLQFILSGNKLTELWIQVPLKCKWRRRVGDLPVEIPGVTSNMCQPQTLNWRNKYVYRILNKIHYKYIPRTIQTSEKGAKLCRSAVRYQISADDVGTDISVEASTDVPTQRLDPFRVYNTEWLAGTASRFWWWSSWHRRGRGCKANQTGEIMRADWFE